MRKVIGYPLVLIVGLMLGMHLPVLGQQPNVDTTFVHAAYNHAVALYHGAIGNQAIIYNGAQYIGYPFKFETGHPYFLADQNHPGNIVYEQVAFPNLELRYNMVADIVVLVQSNRWIQLASSQISAFTVANHQFIKVEPDNNFKNTPSVGFYEVLYQQQTSVLKKEIKKIKEDVRLPPEGVVRYIYSNTSYYILNNQQYFKIRNKRSMVKAMADKKQAIDKYIRTNRLKYKSNPEQTLTAVAAYYDEIKP